MTDQDKAKPASVTSQVSAPRPAPPSSVLPTAEALRFHLQTAQASISRTAREYHKMDGHHEGTHVRIDPNVAGEIKIIKALETALESDPAGLADSPAARMILEQAHSQVDQPAQEISAMRLREILGEPELPETAYFADTNNVLARPGISAADEPAPG